MVLVEFVCLFSVQCGVQFECSAAFLFGYFGDVAEESRAYSAAAVLLVDDKFIYLADGALGPESGFYGQGYERNETRFELNTKISSVVATQAMQENLLQSWLVD